MTKGIRKILYAADAKDSSLSEANEIITRSPGMFSDEAECQETPNASYT
jgi:RP/EB family microtubule-associated protein